MYSALSIARGTSQHGARTCLCLVRHLGSNLALASAIFIFCLCSVGDTLHPKRRGPNPLVDESALGEWLERERQQGPPPTRDNIIGQASRMYHDSVRTDDRPLGTLTLKSMERWWRLFPHPNAEKAGRLAQHAESVRPDKKLPRDEWTAWFHESLCPALTNVGYNPQYVINEDESGMFIDFDTGGLKVCLLRVTKTCAKRRGYNRRHVTLVACVRTDGFYVRPALLWPSALTRGDLLQHEACPISMKATTTGRSSEDIFMEWLREVACLTSPTANPHKAVVLIVDDSKTHFTRAIIGEAVKLGVHLVALPSHLTDVVQPLDLTVFRPFKAALKKGQRDWRAKNRCKSIRSSLFVQFVTESWMQCVTPSVIMSGFKGKEGTAAGPPPQTKVQWHKQIQNPQPPPGTWNRVQTPMETVSPDSMCHMAQALKDKCKGSVFLNTTPRSRGRKSTPTSRRRPAVCHARPTATL